MLDFIALSFLVVVMMISPGPDFAVVLRSGLLYGRKAGILASLGVGIGNFLHIFLNIFGIGLVIARSPIVFSTLKVFSAAYLFFFGIKGLFGKKKKDSSLNTAKVNKNSFKLGLVTSILNPKAFLEFLSIFAIIFSMNTKLSVYVFYGVWINFIACLWFMFIAYAVTSRILSRKVELLKNWTEKLVGGGFMILGVRLILAVE